MPDLLKIALLAIKSGIIVSILAGRVVIPLVAIALTRSFPLSTPVAIAIGVLSVTPAPPLAPTAQVKAGAGADYVVGLLASQTVVAMVLVPLTIQFMNRAPGAEAQFGAAQVATLVIRTILIPLGPGTLAAPLAPALRYFARRTIPSLRSLSQRRISPNRPEWLPVLS